MTRFGYPEIEPGRDNSQQLRSYLRQLSDALEYEIETLHEANQKKEEQGNNEEYLEALEGRLNKVEKALEDLTERVEQNEDDIESLDRRVTALESAPSGED